MTGRIRTDKKCIYQTSKMYEIYGVLGDLNKDKKCKNTDSE